MSRIIIVLFLASFGCACTGSVREPVPAPDAGMCLCEYCAGPQYPIGGHAPVCAGEYKYESCACGDADAGTEFNVH